MRRIMAFLITGVMVLSTAACFPFSFGKTEVTAEFTDAAGLFVGNEVGILGVKVGSIMKIEPDGEGVRVTMEIDSDVKIPKDAMAVIVSRSVATDRYVEMTPTYSGSGPRLESGDVIPIERTKTPVDFDKVLESVNDFSVGIAGNKGTAQAIRRFLAASADTFGPHGKDMRAALTNLGGAVDSISGQRDDVIGTMNSLDVLTRRLVANKGTVNKFIATVADVSQILAAERANFRAALVSLSRAVDKVSTFAKRNKDRLKGTVSKVAEVSDTLLARKVEVAEFLEVMPLLTQNLERATRGGQLGVRAPFKTLLGGTGLDKLCEALPANLCDVLGTDPTGPLVDILDDLLGGGLLGRNGGL